MRRSTTVLAVILSFSAAAAFAGGERETFHAGREGETPVNNAWIRASAPGDRMGAGYMLIRNRNDRPKRLLAVRSDLAERVEIHTQRMVDGLSRMERVPYVEVPAGGEVVFEPGGLHIMFMGLREPFAEGDVHRLVLEFDTIDPIEVDFVVEPITYRGPQMDHDH